MTVHRQSRGGRFGAAPSPRAGFTLVEVIVTTVLLVAVLALLLYYPLTSSFSYFRSATARADAQGAARIALDAVARELTEAMYVQLDMYDNSMIAFMLPLREDPDDPNSEILMPPRPDPTRAIRYWRALYDPTSNYNPGDQLGVGNTYFLARTVVPSPGETSDPWNRWDAGWAYDQNTRAAGGKTNWAAISRVVHSDIDTYVQRRTTTLQPGFPYLYMQYLQNEGGWGQAEAARLYRDYVVALTPNALGYDVSRLEFNPMAVSGEWLRPIRPGGEPDHSVYRSQYPLWRRGTPSTGWSALAETLLVEFPTWARDPFLVIDGYRWDEATGAAQEQVAIGMFDPDSRTMKVLDLLALRAAEDPDAVPPVYDSYYYPVRDPAAEWMAFGVDWIEGAVRFDFPPPQDGYAGDLYRLTSLLPSSSLDGGSKFDAALPLWADRSVLNTPLEAFLISDTVEVWTNSDPAGTAPDLLLTRVECTPRENSSQYQLGSDPALGPGDPPGATAAPNYGWLRLPLSFGEGDATDSHTFWVNFRWHNNGLWYDSGEGGTYYWDLISAYYRTAAILDISLTVTRSDPTARLDDRIAQSANMTRRVKLHNLLRRVRYAED